MLYEQDIRAKAEVQQQWNRLRMYCGGRLIPLLEEMMKFPQLRQLCPGMSHCFLSLHQTTGFPADSSFVILGVLDNGDFAIFGSDGKGGITPTATGNPSEITKLVLDQLPEEWGPAIYGNAQDLQHIRAIRAASLTQRS